MSYMSAQTLLLALLKTMSQFRDTYTANTISFDQVTSKILDSANGLGWLNAGDRLTVAGSTSNNGSYTISSAAAGEVAVSETLVTEAAGDAVTLTRPVNCTEGDDRILDRGITNGAILYPGDLPAYDTAGFGHEHDWEGFIDLFTRFMDMTSYNDFGALRDAVIAAIDASPTLSNAYFVMSITGAGAPSEVYERVNGQLVGPYFITQRLRVAIRENV